MISKNDALWRKESKRMKENKRSSGSIWAEVGEEKGKEKRDLHVAWSAKPLLKSDAIYRRRARHDDSWDGSPPGWWKSVRKDAEESTNRVAWRHKDSTCISLLVNGRGWVLQATWGDDQQPDHEGPFGLKEGLRIMLEGSQEPLGTQNILLQKFQT